MVFQKRFSRYCRKTTFHDANDFHIIFMRFLKKYCNLCQGVQEFSRVIYPFEPFIDLFCSFWLKWNGLDQYSIGAVKVPRCGKKSIKCSLPLFSKTELKIFFIFWYVVALMLIYLLRKTACLGRKLWKCAKKVLNYINILWTLKLCE